MSKNTNLAVFSILALLLLGLVWLHTGKLVPPSGSDAIWFHAGLLTLLIGRFIVEYRFTKPNDVFVNCMVVFASTSTLSAPPHAGWWELIRWGALTCAVTALALAWDPGREAKLVKSRIRQALYHVVTRLGRAEVIFSVVFVLALISYFDLATAEAKVFAITWGVFLLAAQLRIGRLGKLALGRSGFKERTVVGLAHSFLAPSIVFCRRIGDAKVSDHQIVGFTQSASSPCHCFGLVIGERSSAAEIRYAVALIGCMISDAELNDRSLMVTVSPKELEAATPRIEEAQIESLKRVIGTVAKGTNISQVKFEVFGSPALAAGTLLQVSSENSAIYYQIFEGCIDEEAVVGDSARAFVEGDAEQVGYWDPNRGGFETHGWVAKERATVFVLNEDEPAPAYELKNSEVTVGRIPRSNFPANLDLNDLILYHSAVLGVTGSGKSYLTFKLIEEAAEQGVKVICIDPTGDYQRYLHGAVLLDRRGALQDFLASSDHNIGIVETALNADNPIRQARMAAQACLDWCKANRNADEILNPPPKILMVFEEAHLLVPEWNFNPERGLQDEVSKTSQIVLQARKYGLGFLIVAQRTANVVKSVLNQCNTMVSFQAFDETGFDFLKNYMGSYHVRSLPNLKPRHGIIVGKASRSRRPIMVHFEDQVRELRAAPVDSMPAPPAPRD